MRGRCTEEEEGVCECVAQFVHPEMRAPLGVPADSAEAEAQVDSPSLFLFFSVAFSHSWCKSKQAYTPCPKPLIKNCEWDLLVLGLSEVPPADF